MEFLAKLIEWLKLPPQIMVALALISGICAFGPTSFLSSMGITGFVDSHRAWFGIAFLFSFVTLLTYPIASAYRWLLMRMDQRIKRAEVKEHLFALTKDEKEILQHYIRENTRTAYFGAENGAVKSLSKANVLYVASMIGRRSLGGYPYNIHPWVATFLKENYDQVLGE